MDSQIANRHSIDASVHSEQPGQDMDDDIENGRSSIRTLQFVHRGRFIYYEIHEYFQQFGRIESMQINLKNDVHYGYVRVEIGSMVAKAVLSKVSHRIANCVVNVGEVNRPDERILAPLNPLSVPTDQDATNHILILNDDCLRNVLERLNLSDLGKAADVCVRFNQQAKEVFRSKYKDFSKDTVNFYRLKKSDIGTILRNFGLLIESLGIDEDLLESYGYNEESDIVFWIAKHCCNVKKLTITDVRINQTFKTLQSLFAKVEFFFMDKFHYFSFRDMDETMVHLLSVCDNLKTLHIECDANNSHIYKMKCIGRKFPLLQEANIVGFIGIENDTLKSMITLNPKLQKLTIKSGNSKRSTKVLRWIGQHLINLTELEFDEGLRVCDPPTRLHQDDIQCLSSLGSLKVLKLKFDSFSVTPLMESLAANETPIEHLDLRHGLADNAAIKAISKLKQIKTLELSNTRNMTDDYLIELAKELPQLSELHLTDTLYYFKNISAIGITKAITHANQLSLFKLDLVNKIKIDVDDYKAMLKSVRNRPKLTKLLIDIKNKVVEVNVSEAILHHHRDWLDIRWCMNDKESVDEFFIFLRRRGRRQLV